MMPYRHAHWFLLLLFPLTALAFWPGYFSDVRSAPRAFHVHGITASLWIVLLAAQSWSIHARRSALHKSTGYSSFLLLPLFTVGGLLVLQTTAGKFEAGTDPFSAMYGARLGAADVVSALTIPWLFYQAMRYRRKVHVHARYLLGTVFFLLAPIFARLMPYLPPLAIQGPQDMYKFGISVHLSALLAITLALFLYARAPTHGRPWLIIATLLIVQSVLFETVGRTDAWGSIFTAAFALPETALVTLGLALGFGSAWLGWSAGKAGPRKVVAV